MLLDDPVAKLTFAGQRVIANNPGGGRIVEVPGGVPRVVSLIFGQCSPRLKRVDLGGDGVPRRVGPISVCAPVIRGNLWVDRPGRLELRFSGGQAAQQVAAGGKVTAIPPGKDTTVTVDVPGRPTAFEFQLDWQGGAPQFPELQAIDLVQGSTRQDLLGRAGA